MAMSASSPRHLRQSIPSGARNVNSPNGSLPSSGSSFSGTCASVVTREGVRAAKRIASGPRPRCRSSFARTALMLKNVAGGRLDAPWEPGMKSPAATTGALASPAKELEAKTPNKRTTPDRNANEPSFRNVERGIIRDVPDCWERQSTSDASITRPNFVIGTHTAGRSAYGGLSGVRS